jgi:hypothetical protein
MVEPALAALSSMDAAWSDTYTSALPAAAAFDGRGPRGEEGMPGVSWSSLQVVAADGLVAERGVALRMPILRDEGGHLLVPSGLAEETVMPRQVLREIEVCDLLDGGVWIPVRPMPARRNHIVVLRGAPFAGACQMVDLDEDLVWVDHHGRVDIAYVDREVAARWRARCAARLTRWAEKRIGEHLAQFGSRPALANAQSFLELALFVTNQDTEARRRVFVLLGIVLTETSPASWPLVAETALAESPGLDQAQLDQAIEAAWAELKSLGCAEESG